MHRLGRPRLTLAIGLAALAGAVDAIGFLSASGYFVSFMSGNTTRLAVNLASKPAEVLVPALLIAGFVIGVSAGAWLAYKAGAWRKPAIAALVCVLLIAAAVAHGSLRLALLVFAMGALNNTFQRNGEVSVGLTYMTGALVRFGQGLGLAFAGVRREGWASNALLWLGLAVGAVLGALALTRLGEGAYWLIASQAALMAILAWRIAAREAAQSGN